MSNNIVHLSGWLEVDCVPAAIPLKAGRAEELVLNAWLYTDKPYLGGRHPVLITGQPALITLQWARESDPRAGLPQVVLQGKLISRNESSLVLAKVIHFLGSLNPTVNELRAGLLQLYQQTPDARQRAAILELIECAGGLPVFLTGEEVH